MANPIAMIDDIPSNVLKEIVEKSDLEEGLKFKTRKLSEAGKLKRQDVMKSQPDSIEGKLSAALEIQRVWRGYRSRCKLFEIFKPLVSDTAVYGGSKHHMARLDDFLTGPKKSRARLRLEQYYRVYVFNMKKAKVPKSEIASFEEFCANFIQNWWKRLRHRAAKKKKRLEKKTPSPLKPKRLVPLTPEEAAVIIQRTWRRHIDIQVYRYYRDLINFKTRGDPSLMLRCINPNEAKLLDPGLGVHVRFRLAGSKFPPNIYYKIFTHRPIIDMCANSPKDYTRAGAKQVHMSHAHNRTGYLPSTDKEGWYERVENNGWRLVSDRLIQHIMNDPLTWESSRKKVDFHHSKLQRRQDLEKKKKEKKIQWMKKMYKDGLLKAKSTDTETIRLIEGAAAGMVATADREGCEALEEWEVDELLDWTTSLNFEEYMTSWKEIATSANSEKNVEERLKVASNTADPFELTISVEPSARFSPRQSARENTPVSCSEHMFQLQT